MSSYKFFKKKGRGIIESVEVITPENPTHAIICLPGRGQNGFEFIEAIMSSCKFNNTCIISFTPKGFAWYPMPHSATNQEAAVNGLPQAIMSIQKELEDIQKNFEIKDEKLAIIGFSAGAVMALQYLFESKKNLAAIISHSGAIFQPWKVPVAENKTPVVLFHNINDDCFNWDERFIPMQKSLLDNGYNTFELIDRGGHAMYVEDIEHVEMFLKSVGFSTSRMMTDERSIVPSFLSE